MSEPAGPLLHEYFDRAAERWPDRIALEIPAGPGHPERQSATYAQLDAAANRLASRLNKVVKEECIVAILLPRHSPRLFAAQLAVLRAGAAYTCLDHAFPDGRLREMLEDSAAVVLLTDTAGVARAQRIGLPANLAWDVTRLPPSGTHAPKKPSWLGPRSLAYTIYTSGTTGLPKAVMIEHAGIANLVAADLKEFRLPPQARVVQGSSAAYDSSVEEIWLAFAAGATLVVMDDDTARLGPDLIPWLQRERITVFCPPPTLLRATGCQNPQRDLPELDLLYVGGEALPQDLSDAWSVARRLVNGYGPTECTVTALRGPMVAGVPVHIGHPVTGLFAHVLDDDLHEVPDGQWGELCIGGAGLARGYWKRPELTAEKFPSHPVLGRIYRTGDLVHKNPHGDFEYHGRTDSQVKLRGYRLELGEIESRLSALAGIRAAACKLQGPDGQQTLVAFLVPRRPDLPPDPEAIRAALADLLPAYMIPARFGIVAELPVTVGGKLNRAALPDLALPDANPRASFTAPRSSGETMLAEAVRTVLGLHEPVSVDDDFFAQLGGDSLRAAQLVSLLRREMPGTHVAVRDIYQARTVAALWARMRGHTPGPAPTGRAHEMHSAETRGGHPFIATVIQALWLAAGFSLAASAAWLVFFEWAPRLWQTAGTSLALALALPALCAALVLYSLAAVCATVLAKRCLIGRYVPLRAPVWGSFYVRNWMVQQVARTVPWNLMEGTVFQATALRALGARIGQRVHLHRGVNLYRGGWDLLELGDDVTLSQDAALGLVELDDGHIVVGPVKLGNGVTVDIRGGLSPHTAAEDGAFLTALSHLPSGRTIPAGERWDGVPARPAGPAPTPPQTASVSRPLSPALHGLCMVAAQCLAAALPFVAPAALGLLLLRSTSPAAAMLLSSLAIPVSLAFEAAFMRSLGCVQQGVIGRLSLAHIRVCLKTEMLRSAGEWLSGTLFWPVWLRWAGMRVGPGCEISTIVDVVPELISIGDECFFADGIYLGGPRLHRGTVTLAATSLARGTFLGNHAIVPAGQHLAGNLLVGVCTVADAALMRSGTSWFGHPPFELPNREVVACDRSLTYEPSPVRYWNRVFWESLRFALPLPPLLVAIEWYRAVSAASAALARPVFVFAAVPLLTLAASAALCALVLALKWALLGRVKPGHHPLWSCWCSRWDFLYVAWGFFTRGTLASFEGTLLLSWYLRAMGATLGKRVVLGSGFAQVVDPDMLIAEDGATLNCTLQAHTFEDRVLKIDRIRVGPGATLGDETVPLYGADIGAGAHVAPHSVVMKHEHLLPGLRYEGVPTTVSGSGSGPDLPGISPHSDEFDHR